MYNIESATIYLLLFIIYQVKFIAANDELLGDDCKLSSNDSGKCVLLKDCRSALDELKKGIHPKLCSFQRKEPIVCCPNQKTNIIKESISRQKCREYSQYVFELVESLVPGGKVNISRCNIQSNLLISGPIAAPSQFPHMALLGYEVNGKIDWLCSGVLISDQFILTTAICSQSIPRIPVKVRLGTTRLQNVADEENIQEVNISQNIRHPDYMRPLIYNDIALLKLEHSVKFNKYVRPACLADLDQKPSKRLILTGWEFSPAQPQDKLLYYYVEKISYEECNKSFDKNRRLSGGIDNNTHLCATFNDFTCSTMLNGSPLQSFDKDIYCTYDVQGILSIGNACQKDSAYTNILPYINWIEKIVWP